MPSLRSPAEVRSLLNPILRVVRELAEALSLYREKNKQVRDLRRFIDQLDSIISDRQNRYKVLRR